MVVGEYAMALRTRDAGTQRTAPRRLVAVERTLAGDLSGLTGGRVSVAAAQGVAQQHVEHLLGQADALAAGDYRRAYTLLTRPPPHEIDAADVLARAIAPQQRLATTELDAPRR